MDALEFIKCFTPKQKDMVICFIILLPCYFTMMLLFVPPFSNFQLLYQAIISVAVTIGMMFVSHVFLIPLTFTIGSSEINPSVTAIINLCIMLNVLLTDDYVFEWNEFKYMAAWMNGTILLLPVIILLIELFKNLIQKREGK